MSPLQSALDEYLALRHALGHKLRLPGRLLQRFVDFADHTGATYITTELALGWATQPADAQPAQWANRLGMVRRFARYCSATEPRTIVPPRDLLPHRYRRPLPYVYSDEEIVRLLEAAKHLPPVNGLRSLTFATLFGLYVATGMRCNEPLRLDRGDVDLQNGVLTVRDTKFGKSRYVPVHPTTQRALQRYAIRRDRLCRNPVSPSFFLSDRGTRLTEWCVRWTFVKLSCQIDLRGADDREGLAFMTFAIDWLLPRSFAGIATASMLSATCLNSRPISAMRTSPTPTGTSRRHRSCCAMRCCG
jgi:integrase/recombinase XerD